MVKKYVPLSRGEVRKAHELFQLKRVTRSVVVALEATNIEGLNDGLSSAVERMNEAKNEHLEAAWIEGAAAVFSAMREALGENPHHCVEGFANRVNEHFLRPLERAALPQGEK